MATRVNDSGGVIPAVINRVELFAAQTEDVRKKLSTATRLWEFSKGETVTEAVEPVGAVRSNALAVQIPRDAFMSL